MIRLDLLRVVRVNEGQRGSAPKRFVPSPFPREALAKLHLAQDSAHRAKQRAHPTRFEPVTFGFVDSGLACKTRKVAGPDR
jgi:hypothetical protein